MEHKAKPTNLQTIKTRVIYFPNQTQSVYPNSVKAIEERFKLPPHHANLIAELQGYKMGGA